MPTPWELRFAHRTEGMKSSFIRELLKVTSQPDVISFGGGFPLPNSSQSNMGCSATKFSIYRAQALQYTTEGYNPLASGSRTTQKQRHQRHTPIIMITTGSQQALDFVGRIFINRGDRILTESPTYLGAIQAWNAYGPQYVTANTDADGMVTDELENLIRQNVKFMYVLPNFHNPLGVTLSLERRKRLIELANRYNVPMIEDDPYGKLIFE